jgi:glycosyltransferase involved in cell wall biosynthesis
MKAPDQGLALSVAPVVDPLLTVAVPTYNRAASLRRSLGAIVRQIAAIEGGWERIELLVSDNCSTDDTPAVIAEFSESARIRYLRNPSNLGMEGNFLSCFEQARGRLVWTFSDDDLLVDGVLQKVLDLASSSPVDLIYMRPKFLFGELESFSSQAVDFRFDPVTAEYYALRANGLLSFLSAVVVNKQRYLALRQDDQLRRYAGTFLAHYEWIYTLLAVGQHFFMASQPVIRARTGATGGYDVFKVFGEYYIDIGKEKFPGQPRIRRDFELAMLYMHIPGFIRQLRENAFGRFEYVPERIAEQVRESYGDSFFYRAVIRTLLFGGARSSLIAYRYSQFHSRAWMVLRRLLTRKSPPPHLLVASKPAERMSS